MDADKWLLGKDAAIFLEPWVNSRLTDLFYSLYLFFFVYLGISLWYYGSGDLQILRQFISGLFTVYGIGFLGYTLLPAGGPYLEIPGHFSIALTGSWVTNYSTALVAWGSNRVDCFPCLHFAVTFYILVFDCWHCRRRFYWMLLPCVGIWTSTIYLRQHYLVDLFGGLVLSVFALWLIKPNLSATSVIKKTDGI
ncbi:MAG: phosphatase PAP2 family protein [Limisphaerales bacterium]